MFWKTIQSLLRVMSFVDIAFLKKSDLHNGEITYCRRKTRQQIKVKIEPETRMLIDSFGNSETDYLLPIITKKDVMLSGSMRVRIIV